MLYTVKLTHSLFEPFILQLLDGWVKTIQNIWILVFSYFK